MTKKRRASDNKPEDSASYRVVSLNSAAGPVLVTGLAMLEVLEGCVDVDGKLLRVGDVPIRLSTGRNGLAIAVQGLSSHGHGEGACVRLPHLGHCQISLSALNLDREFPGPAFSVHQSESTVGLAPPSLDIPHDWHEAIREICHRFESNVGGALPPPVVVVCGGKGSGKSSLSRLLVNHLLNSAGSVWYLDTDLGQPELTAPGMVSLTCLSEPLLGPSFTHLIPWHLSSTQSSPHPPSFAHFLGDVSPQGDPERYCSAVRSLYQKYCQYGMNPKNGKWPPIIVNTCGWIKGVGLDVLADLISSVLPSHVIELQSQVSGKLPPGLFWLSESSPPSNPCSIINATPLSASHGVGESNQEGGIKASDARALLWHAWAKEACGLNSSLGCYEGEGLWSDASRLCSLRPLMIEISRIRIKFLFHETPLTHDHTYIALNGSVVGLAEEGDGGEIMCLGLGIVRSVDAVRGVLYVITPLARCGLEVVERATCLLVGKTNLPSSLLQSNEAVSPYLTLFSLSMSDGSGAGGSGRSRSNLGRKGDRVTLR